MAMARTKDLELDVHQTVAPTSINTAYGSVQVPAGHYVLNLPGEFSLRVPLTPDVFDLLFEMEPDVAPEAPPADAPSTPTDPASDPSSDPPAPAPGEATAPADAAAPADAPPAPVDGEISPEAGATPAAPPDAAPDAAQAAPSQAAVEAWVAAHYHRSYRPRHVAGLMANPARAAELLARYPIATADTNEPPPPDEA